MQSQLSLIGVQEKPKLPRHPARYTDALLPVFADLLSQFGYKRNDEFRIIDPFGGTGKIFKMNQYFPNARIDAVEIEPEWAAYNPRTTVGNALSLPWGDGTFQAVITSPTYSNRMADHHEASDASRRNTYTHALGRKLSEDNSGKMQWSVQYRDFHQRRGWKRVGY